MDPRIPIMVTLALIVLAFGGFFFALSPRSSDVVLPVQPAAPAPTPAAPDRAAQTQAPAIAPDPSKPAAGPVAAGPVPASPETKPVATPASIEAEVANSENAELQSLLKANFAGEYGELMIFAAQRRNEGISGEPFREELDKRLEDLMRPKLKFAVSASMPTIDKLAANEANLFHALGTDAAPFCLKLLGKDGAPSTALPPANVRDMMRLGTFYRFQAIVEGMSTSGSADPLTPDDMKAFEAGLAGDGLKFDDIRSGAFITKDADAPGQPCLTLEKLYRAIARLPEETRRKIYAGMFFLGRDK